MGALKKLINSEAFNGVLLCFIAVIAFSMANSRFYPLHHAFLEYQIFSDCNIHFFINEILMSLFFLSVGIEVRHEIKYGVLSKWKHALLPIIGAFGGVLAPAIIFLLVNKDKAILHGWAIPTATDIAFAIGIYSLLAKNFPRELRIILLSIAIIDDIIAILIIALFYNSHIDLYYLAASLALIITLSIYAYFSKRVFMAIFGMALIMLWFTLQKSGIHPTLSGVVIGMIMPLYPHRHEKEQKFVNLLNNIVSYFIMPIFIFANAAVALNHIDFNNTKITLMASSIAIALLCGKPIGIFTAMFLSVKAGICHLPKRVTLPRILYIGILAGIGFTMALFTILLSFNDENFISAAKLGVCIGSVVSAILGIIYGTVLVKTHKCDQHDKD